MKNNKIRLIVNLTVITIVLLIVLYFSLKDNYDEIMTSILNMNHYWILSAVILLCLYRIFTGISIKNLTYINNEKIPLWRSIQISFIILFFHGVTPFASGGQPMEVYYLHNENISITKATNIVLQNFILYQIALVLISTFAVIYNHFYLLFPEDSLIKKLVILGFIINLLVLLLSFILSFGKKVKLFILDKGIDFLNKFKLIKDPNKTRKELSSYLTKFHSNAVKLKKHKKEMIINIFINIIALIAQYSIPFAVFQGLGVNNLTLTSSIVATAYVMTIGSFIPIPGGTGGIEYGFIYFFKNLINGSVLNATMLVWRFISYYLGIIIGAISLALYRKKEQKCE